MGVVACACVRSCASRQGGYSQGDFNNYNAGAGRTCFTSWSHVAVTNQVEVKQDQKNKKTKEARREEEKRKRKWSSEAGAEKQVQTVSKRSACFSRLVSASPAFLH